MNVLVLGGYGEVGARIVTELRDHGEVALAAGRDPRRADIVIDLREPHTLTAALPGVDVVVNAAGAEEPTLVETITRHGAAFVDITATTDYVAALERLAPSRPVILSVGLAPGLTNLLAAAVHDTAPQQPIDIALLLGAGERYRSAAPNVAADWWNDVAGPTRSRGLVLLLPDPPEAEAMSLEVAERLGAETARLEGLSHCWMAEAPDVVARTLERFWSSLE
jgi:hypothetical protein